ncbi:TPA: hypothetical protein ACPVXH_003977 [Vibrio parahaemolyticus]
MAFRFLAYVRLNLSIQTGQVIKRDFVVQSWLGLNIQAKSTVLSRQIITLRVQNFWGV